ncbi:hypothetical protein [Silvimonas amylolytica]|uniref:PH domain-containing protein n=1 Tax=Silvimonas amylolytica TaxID=449663 RepID=A0ABQ2PKB3_9NEIS|nr:hypothetical protein [Silvimonas amylolytica]GGP25674.1 hypothetical protein GCM10010971_14930 [Silvimonas amylolytica]
MLTHRNASKPAWLVFGVVLIAAAGWGWPLIDSPRFENHFFGLFWYSMLLLAAGFWAFPAEQRVYGGVLERRICFLGLIPVRTRHIALTAFTRVVLDQEPNIIGPDSVWVCLADNGEARFVFSHYRATRSGVAKAVQEAHRLAALAGLPFTEQAPETMPAAEG